MTAEAARRARLPRAACLSACLLAFLLACLLTPTGCEAQQLQTIAYATLDTASTQVRVTVLPTSDPQEADKLIPSNYIAKAIYSNQINETGWDFLEVQSSESAGDAKQARGAGVLEGYLTARVLQMHVSNVARPFCDGRLELCQNIQNKFLDVNLKWVKQQVHKLADEDPYWHQVRLFYIQQDALLEGYKLRRTQDPSLRELTSNDILWLNVQGDLEDLVTALAPPHNRTQMEHGRVLGSGSCSALIKILPGFKDIFVSQDTWSSYETMLRIQKKYILNYHIGGGNTRPLPGRAMSFSSYPGVLTSGDDFYITSSGLVTLETTIGNSNDNLWRFVQPNTVAEGTRSMVANRLATNGSSWYDVFSLYNSGTYNNQWMIVDLKRFQRGKRPRKGLLYLLEQLPGHIEGRDLTEHLVQHDYFASYNVPFFPKTFADSGAAGLAEKYGDWFTYDKCPRARIFRRDQSDVKDLSSMWKLMRSNDFKNDPLSVCNCTPTHNGENAIAARSDLNPADGKYPWGALGHRNHGATDTKITSPELARDLRFLGESGPPHYSASCPPFSWATADFAATTPHEGLPDTWTFPPVLHEWAWRSA